VQSLDDLATKGNLICHDTVRPHTPCMDHELPVRNQVFAKAEIHFHLLFTQSRSEHCWKENHALKKLKYFLESIQDSLGHLVHQYRTLSQKPL
jgi:hypothetical protein